MVVVLGEEEVGAGNGRGVGRIITKNTGTRNREYYLIATVCDGVTRSVTRDSLVPWEADAC